MQQFPAFLMLWLLASTAMADTAADRLRDALAATTSLEGEFTQTLFDADGEELETSAGEFILQRPGRFYWHTTEPFEQLVVSNQQTLWLYDPDLEQVTVREVTDEVRKTPAMVLSDDVSQIAESFHITEEERKGHTWFVLEPVSDDELFTLLELEFVDDELLSVELEDGLGQRTVFKFANTTRNRPVDESLFTFDIPDGVDVLID